MAKHEYRDHDIEVEAIEIAHGRFNWRHFVVSMDQGWKEGREGGARTAEIAEREGLEAAMRRIDEWMDIQGKS